MRMRDALVEEQIQWVLLYIQERSVDIWKKSVIEDLKNKSLEFPIVGEFLSDLKQKFRNGNDKSVKIAGLMKMEQGGKTMEEFI